MRRRVLSLVLAAIVAAPVVLLSCAGDDDVYAPADATRWDGTIPDRAAPTPAEGGGPVRPTCGDAGAAPPRALVSYGGEVVAIDLASAAVAGRVGDAGGALRTSAIGTEPYLLGGESDVVLRLDAREPWRPIGRWNVHGDDAIEGLPDNALPVTVVPVSCSKAYVIRRNRGNIAVIDQSEPDGGAPLRFVDLSPLRQQAHDVLATSAVFVPSKKRVYVVVANADPADSACTTRRTSVVAIDVETDAIVGLGGTAPGEGIALEGERPWLEAPLVYDGAFDRLLVVQRGCDRLDDAGTRVVGRGIEQVDLATGAAKNVLSLDDRAPPARLAVASSDQAIVVLSNAEAYRWDPRQPVLGARLEGGLDLVARDGRGAFVGTRGAALVAVAPGDAGDGVTVLTTLEVGRAAGIEAWP